MPVYRRGTNKYKLRTEGGARKTSDGAPVEPYETSITASSPLNNQTVPGEKQNKRGPKPTILDIKNLTPRQQAIIAELRAARRKKEE